MLPRPSEEEVVQNELPSILVLTAGCFRVMRVRGEDVRGGERAGGREAQEEEEEEEAARLLPRPDGQAS